jgi:hypothetical protein
MNIHRQLIVAVSCAAVLAATGIVARAGDVPTGVTVTASFSSDQPNTVGVNLTSNYNESDAGATTTTISTVAGIYNFTETDSNGVFGGPNSTFQGVCIDFTHDVWCGQSGLTFEVEPLDQVLAQINAVGISADQAKAIAYLRENLYPSSVNAQTGAIFQMAVWDLIYSSAYSAASPAPTVTYSSYAGSAGDVLAASNQAAAAWAARDSADCTLYALINTNPSTAASPGAGGPGPYQSFLPIALVESVPSVAMPVPLPASASVGFAMLSLFGVLFAIRNRRNRSRRARIA